MSQLNKIISEIEKNQVELSKLVTEDIKLQIARNETNTAWYEIIALVVITVTLTKVFL